VPVTGAEDVDDPARNKDSFVPALEYGLMTVREWNNVLRKSQNESEEELVRYLKNICFQRYPLFASFFLGLDIPPYVSSIYQKIKQHDKVLALISRGAGKTFLLNYARIVHDICYAHDSDFDFDDPRCLVLRDSEDTAKDDVITIQQWIKNGGPKSPYDYINHYAGFRNEDNQTIEEAADRWNATSIQLPTSTSRDKTLVGRGLQSKITGLHSKLLVADDIVTQDNSRTPGQQSRIRKRWGRKVEQGILGPGTDCFVVGTKYFHGDLYSNLTRDERDDWLSIKKPALNRMPTDNDYEPVYNEDVGVRVNVNLTEQGQQLESLWPCPLGVGNCPVHRWGEHVAEVGYHISVQYLIHDRFIGRQDDFANQQMLKVISPSETRIKPDMLNFWSNSGDLLSRTREGAKVGDNATNYNNTEITAFPTDDEIVSVIHAWDHALGKNDYNNNTAFARLFRTADNNVYVKMRAEKMDFLEAVDLMEAWYEDEENAVGMKPDAIVTEVEGMQDAYSEVLSKSAKTMLGGKIKEVSRGNMDKDRYLNKSGVLQALRNSSLYIEYEDDDFVKELLHFTPDGSSAWPDDRLDAIAMGFDEIKSRRVRQARSWDLDITPGGPGPM
jgi:hypothetical protein